MRFKKFLSVLFVLALFSIAQMTACGAAGSDLRYFCQPSESVGSTTPYGNNTASGHYVQSGDAKIYYEVYGKGKPVFILHGGGVGTPYEMGIIIDQLRENYQTVVISSRGHGRSEIGHEPISLEQKAADVISVMREITAQPAALIGFSDGAYTAYEVAALYPNAVERIAAIGAGTLTAGFFSSDMTLADLEKIDPAFIAQQKAIAPEPERMAEFFKDYMAFWSKKSIGKDLFSSIKCPVLLIAGDEDDHAPLVTMVEAHQLIANSRLAIIPKAWHTAFLDNEPLTNLAIKEFMASDAKDLLPSKKVSYNNTRLFGK
jgi:pimeloyl-ACP methyl ester carboxylesterase